MMRLNLFYAAIAAIVLGFTFGGCRQEPLPPDDDRVIFPDHFPPLSLSDDLEPTPERVKLGKRLFFDKALSIDSTVSCGTCHKPELAFTDGLAFSDGVKGRKAARNAPSVANVAWSTTMFWDGGKETLEMQAIAPIENPDEMGNTIAEALRRLNADAVYVSEFQEAYGRNPDVFSLTRALSAYQRSLISAGSRYDRYLKGDTLALTESERRGRVLFFGETAECFHCHAGNLLSDFTFQNNGLYRDYPDGGRFRITGNERDHGKFKVPSLRNVALTAPYMHDGSIATLEAVLQHYESGGQRNPNKSILVRPFQLTPQERQDLIAFLHALTDIEFINNPRHRP